MSPPDLARLRRALGHPDLGWLLERLRRRLERGGALTGTVSLGRPTPAQRAAFDRLLGRPPSRGETLTARLEDLDERVRRAELAAGLGEAVEALTGPLSDRRGARAAAEARWAEPFAAAEAAVAGGRARPEVTAWLARLRADGLLRRLAGGDPGRGRKLLEAAVAVVLRLPAGGMPLAELAAAVTGDSHALDPGRPLATLVLRAAAALGGVGGVGGGARDAQTRRDVWASVGVLADELSGSVLVLNLRAAPHPPSLTGAALALHAEAGEPLRLTPRQLLGHPPRFAPGVTGPAVHVCENPAVVAAAAHRLGAAGAPLISIEGQPNTAARLLLAALARAGVALRYHGDFDWPGLRIAALVFARHGAVPWRFGAADYRAAHDQAAHDPNTHGGGPPLGGAPVDTPWDPALRGALETTGRAVHEEQVLEDLLGDLAAGAGQALRERRR